MARRTRQEKKAKTVNKPKIASLVHEEALAITDGVVKPGFSKQQRKEIQKAVEAGIAQYKRQHSAKQRHYNKLVKRMSTSAREQAVDNTIDAEVESLHSAVWLPWILLGVSWIGFVAFILIDRS